VDGLEGGLGGLLEGGGLFGLGGLAGSFRSGSLVGRELVGGGLGISSGLGISGGLVGGSLVAAALSQPSYQPCILWGFSLSVR
jgi:hypothetical protein